MGPNPNGPHSVSKLVGIELLDTQVYIFGGPFSPVGQISWIQTPLKFVAGASF